MWDFLEETTDFPYWFVENLTFRLAHTVAKIVQKSAIGALTLVSHTGQREHLGGTEIFQFWAQLNWKMRKAFFNTPTKHTVRAKTDFVLHV